MTHLWSVAFLIVAECMGVTKVFNHNTKDTENNMLWPTHTHTHHTHTQTRDDGAPCWPNPSLINPSLMWSGHAITLPTLAFTYGHACTQTVWVTLIGMTCQQVHMRLTCTPTNALHVRCMFVQLTWCEHRCNQFDHWDIHAWYYYYIIYMTYHIIDRLSVILHLQFSAECCIHREHTARPQHENIENTLLDHSTRTWRTHC